MKRLIALVFVLCAITAALVVLPSDHYLFLPDRARAVDPLVEVPDEPRGDEEGGIYMVDILVRKASLLERIFPGVESGATLVPEHFVNPEGLSDEERHRESLGEMSVSQKIAIAVALRNLGHEVPTQAVVERVEPGTPAEGTLERGDVILEAKARSVDGPDDVLRIMTGHDPGTPVRLTIRRDGDRRTLQVGTQPSDDDADRAIMGILVGLDIDPPIDVEIDAGDIGGPSAGLAFALDVLDEMGREVDDGRRIAVTGALGLDGDVVPVGGLKQKAIGARESGADLFVVPDENAREARRNAEDLEVVAVGSFAEALTELGVETG
ncbi:MAG: PDZ domain-containing protein [Actinobacteria bacterium]|nr:PDZ domain-containing protein [Actinomycetota bacterium]